MLTNFHVKSFKSLEDVEVELGHINVFIGANGSGKSNLLEAIGVLGAAANGRVDDEALLRRGVRPGLPALYKSSFKGSHQPNNIDFSAQSDSTRYSVGLNNPLSDPEPTWRFATERLQEQAEASNGLIVDRSPESELKLNPSAGYAALKQVELAENSAASVLLRSLQQYVIYSPDTATLRGLTPDPQSRDPIGLSGGRLAEAIVPVVAALAPRPNDPTHTQRREEWEERYNAILELIDWADGVGFVNPGFVPISASLPQPTRLVRFRDKYMAEGRDVLSGYDASEGALYVLFMAVLCHHPHIPPVLAVDNFDHALNPRLARALTRKVCEWVLARSDHQMLLTSHNPLVLDGLPLRDDRVRLFTVQRSNKGKTVVRRVEVSDQLLRYAEEGVPLSQQWVMGTFGGVPDI